MKKFFKRPMRLIALGAAVVLGASAIIAPFAAANEFPDFNNDKRVNNKDLIMLKYAINGNTTDLTYDINGDNAVNVADIEAMGGHVINPLAYTPPPEQYFLRNPLNGDILSSYSSFDIAKAYVDTNWMMGYAVTDADGKTVYSKTTDLQTKILFAAKTRADMVKTNNFRYSSAAKNPAHDCSDRKVSCDRFVAWALFDAGFTTQPRDNGGIMVYTTYGLETDLTTWCQNRGFIRINSIAELQPGDIIFSGWCTTNAGTKYPGHTFIYGGNIDGYNHYRYDCGCENRIRCANQAVAELGGSAGGDYSAYATTGQPFKESIPDFCYAYRPVEPNKYDILKDSGPAVDGTPSRNQMTDAQYQEWLASRG